MSWLNMTMSIVSQNLAAFKDYTNWLTNQTDILQTGGLSEQRLSELRKVNTIWLVDRKYKNGVQSVVPAVMWLVLVSIWINIYDSWLLVTTMW